MKTLIRYSHTLTTFCVLSLLSWGSTARQQDPTDILVSEIQTHSYGIQSKENRFGGKGYDWLQANAASAQYFLIGEEHGIAENPLLAAQLFESLVIKGYQHLAIEVSPPMAKHLDNTLKNGGINALKDSFSLGTEPAFFGMAEEALMLSKIRNASLKPNAFWGLDYEVAGDKVLLKRLAELPKPEPVKPYVAKLVAASQHAWQKYMETKGPQYIFSFSGQPQLVKNVMDHWPNPPQEATQILKTLYETLAINSLWVSGEGYLSNQRRAQLFRDNFAEYWRQAPDAKVMIKLGASHVMRGLNINNTYDVGNLIPELATINGSNTFSMLVLPGKDSHVAVLDPTHWRYRSAPAKDGYTKGLELFYTNILPKGFTVFDLTPLRKVVFAKQYSELESIRNLVMRFDALLIMTGSTPSAQWVEH
ncbi:hypothetical protein [Aliiglaciecola sp. M165]|uniref:hypothetical protein n=1 Tax=Aliiglaciecola sp. M165 TaxID=2593649 RepID=UPI00117F5DB5|nr:hypothetical protein [Aliiglaciecola sp. M165]TRY34041.1 hypothetical protein FM019_01930 [Aliiglaciecola sp. M165]